MKRFVRHTMLGFVPALIAVFVFATPTAADLLSLQNVNLSCSDGSSDSLALDLATVTNLTNAVSAINLYPAGDPALACGLSQTSGDPGGPQDFAVGGGRFFNYFIGCEENFAINTHAPDDVTGPDTAHGTGNLTIPEANGCTLPGHLVTKVDCQMVSGNTADFTSVVTKSSGIFPSSLVNINVGDEIAWEVKDMDPLQDEIFANIVGKHATSQCDFAFHTSPTLFSIDQGNINVHDN